MRPANNKLRERAVRIICLLIESTSQEATAYLKEADYHIPTAALMAAHHCNKKTAQALLTEADGVLKEALKNAPHRH